MSRPQYLNGAAPVQRELTLSAQTRLLFAGANVILAVTVLASSILSYLSWNAVPHAIVLPWWIYIIAVAIGRYILAFTFHHAPEHPLEADRWRIRFAIGAAFSGVGWGAAGLLFYDESRLVNQIFLIFVIGGMMLGAVSLLAPRKEAYLAFLAPAGLGPTLRLLAEGDRIHVIMGLLAAVFTVATLITTARICHTIESSLALQFRNRDLLEDLRAAKHHVESLNQALELRVQERTAELQQSTEQLRAEIAHRERMEEELLRARKLESLGVLAGGIAHDFNNFLTVVQGNIELAKTKMPPGDRTQEILDQAASTCRRAAQLSSQLLTFAKGGAPVRRLVSLAGLTLDAVRLVRAGTPVSISVHLPDDLFCGSVDPGQIGQVLHNLLLNAVQAMPEGGIIEVSAENLVPANAAPRVRISIRDYGCGIPPESLPRIFDPYFTTKKGGSGLGLATSYSIISRHDGQISVESTSGVGTVFTIELPASLEKPAALASVPVTSHTGKGRVLVMDDEVALRTLLRAVLNQLGYQARAARDGAEAIALYEAARAAGNPFDAVLLDLTVSGGMGGIEAAVKLKEIDPAAKLIVSSGYSDAPAMSEYAKYGFEAVLAKPWTVPDVAQVLQAVLVPDPDRKPV